MNEHLHFNWASTIVGGFCALAVSIIQLEQSRLLEIEFS